MHLPSLQYDCVSCGKSCSDFLVELRPEMWQRLQELPLTQSLQREGFTPLQTVDDRVFLGKAESGRCLYLSEDKLCRIHQQAGFEHKPWTCKAFPFAPVPTPDGVFVAASFSCTAVARGLGRDLTGREDEFSYLLESPDCEEVPSDSQWSLWGPQAVDWSNYLQIEQFCLDAVLECPRYGLAQAVWRLAMAVGHQDMTFMKRALAPDQIDLAKLQGFGRMLVPVMESETEEVSRAIADAVSSRTEFQSFALGHSVTLNDPPAVYPAWLKEKLQRYLQHVLFRKSLLKAPNVLSRLCLLLAAEEIIAAYTYGSAAYRNQEVEEEDYYKAVGLVEGRLMMHANGMESTVQQWAGYFLQLDWIKSA